MKLIYAELVTDRIEDRGVFLSIAEFAEYRKQGWAADDETNAQADACNVELDKKQHEAHL